MVLLQETVESADKHHNPLVVWLISLTSSLNYHERTVIRGI
jgi:hypothetical protein